MLINIYINMMCQSTELSNIILLRFINELTMRLINKLFIYIYINITSKVTDLEGVLEVAFLLERHTFTLTFIVSAFLGLQVEPSVGESLDLGQQGFDERVVLILRGRRLYCRAYLWG